MDDNNTVFDLFVPGRLCLFGEHSDWAGGYRRINSRIEKGYALITGINQGIYGKVSAHPHKLIYRGFHEGEEREFEIPMTANALMEAAQEGGYFSYIAGVAYQIFTHYHVGGLIIENYKTDLPIRKGLSSSAAICVLTARAFNRVYDLKMTIRGEMDLAYRGEITTPSRCGRMDQGCAYGVRPILMTFDGDSIEVEEVSLKEDLFLVILDLKAEKDTMKILRDLNKAYPFADNPVEEGVRHYLGPVNKELVFQAKRALEEAGPGDIGRLMITAQRKFDQAMMPACPEELTSPVLHKLLENPRCKALTLGGKGVGSQGDGTAQFIVSGPEAQRELIAFFENEMKMEALPVVLKKTKKIRKAVITAAGLGTRLFPMTKIVRKEFMPVSDGTGRMEPLLVKTVREVWEAGIEEICLIIQKDEEREFKKLFKEPVTPEVFAKLDHEGQEYCSYLEEIGEHLVFCHQKSQDGLGHALLEAEQWVDGEPFLFVLGDHYFKTDQDRSCTAQLISWYEELERPILGVVSTPLSAVHRFGSVSGKWEREGEILSVTEFKEKPTQEYAELHLGVEDGKEILFFTVFGQYIFTAEIFTILQEMVDENYREMGEIQLTPALERIRRKKGFTGIVINGERIDIGIPREYQRALGVPGQCVDGTPKNK